MAATNCAVDEATATQRHSLFLSDQSKNNELNANNFLPLLAAINASSSTFPSTESFADVTNIAVACATAFAAEIRPWDHVGSRR